jgi:hypothetical protein
LQEKYLGGGWSTFHDATPMFSDSMTASAVVELPIEVVSVFRRSRKNAPCPERIQTAKITAIAGKD